MYRPRKVNGLEEWLDPDGIKIYTIAADGQPVVFQPFHQQLAVVKQSLDQDWEHTAAFVIFHRGAGNLHYLVLSWWDNDNELFTSVSVERDGVWHTDPTQYSFCLYDMEVMWRERNLYIDTMDCAEPSLEAYRRAR
ncbi:hypothetical protein VA7868_00094 [Vibrio aerogenes CECT 7868]|uniref:Isochorismatase n=1 Tax=Vibrio aerogenes CECT 7868 TaxID=1216006 RepID=A0A1M5UHR1_9VIBR|nr:hypothetical protein [Vibrio aerogenes]SHH62471.1 hypothetical protein VA7868_00094 [Vibrio aerogenes CECT 7868]